MGGGDGLGVTGLECPFSGRNWKIGRKFGWEQNVKKMVGGGKMDKDPLFLSCCLATCFDAFEMRMVILPF